MVTTSTELVTEPRRASRRLRRRSTRSAQLLSRPASLLVSILMGVMVVGAILPLIWMFLSGLKSYREFFGDPWGLPASPEWGNYADAWNSGVASYIGNSLFVTLLSLALVLAVASAGSYALTMVRLPGANVITFLIIGGMMLAPPVALVPLYSLFKTAGWLDNLVALSVLYAAYRLPITLFIIRAYMLTLPKEVNEASRIDGANSWQTFWHIVTPITRPAIVSAGIMHLLFAWNEFPFALVFLQSPERQTMPIGLLNLNSDITTNWPVLFAAMTIAALPIIIVFLSAQGRFIGASAQGHGK